MWISTELLTASLLYSIFAWCLFKTCFQAHTEVQSIIYKPIVFIISLASNILLDDSNNAKISGFSSSKYFQGVLSSKLNDGFLMSQSGTYNFMAPEVFEEDGRVGVKSDIWSFGAILVELVTGIEPFHQMDSVDVALEMEKFKTIKFIAPPGMNDKLKDLIEKCLVADPKNRKSASELLKHDFLNVGN